MRDVPTVQESANLGSKNWNDFYSPMYETAKGANNKYDNSKEFQAQLQLGSKLYPEYPIRSHAEAMHQLRKTLGAKSSNTHNFNIDSHEYRTSKFIWATDMEKVLEASFTGMNTRAGDILNISFDHNDGNFENYATSMHIVLQADNIMVIQDSGITIFD